MKFSNLHKALLLPLMLSLSATAFSEDWYLGAWEMDFQQLLESINLTEEQLIEADPNLLGFKKFGIIFDQSNIHKTLSGKVMAVRLYSVKVISATEVLVETTNNFGPETDILRKTDKGICIEPKVTTDRYGTFEPPRPFIQCYVPSNA